MTKRWTILFKVLSNINRTKIIHMLAHGDTLNVTEIAGKLNISLKATSKHLIILQNLSILNNVGRQGHVFYTLGQNIPADARKAIKLFC